MLLFLFLWPIVELLFWFRLASAWGWSGNLLEILVSGFLGFYLIRRVGLKRLAEIQSLAMAGQSPAASMLQTLCFLLGGLLLILPGVVTDFVGLLLVLPFSRPLMASLLSKSWSRTRGVWVHFGGWQGGFPPRHSHPPASEDIIEVEAVEVKDKEGPVLGRK